MQPVYKNIHTELPRLIYPTRNEVLNSDSREDIYIPFKKSVIARKEEVVNVLKSGILERSEWLQSRSRGCTTEPVFTNKLTATSLRISSDADVDTRIEIAILKRNVTQEGKTMIAEARKNCSMLIASESQEFLDAMQRDIEARFPNPSQSMIESIEKDREREIKKIRKRHVSDLESTVASIQKRYQHRPSRKQQVKEVGPEDDKIITALRECKANNRIMRYELVKELDDKHKRDMDTFELAAKDFPSSVNVDTERKSYATELMQTYTEVLKDFDTECDRLERPFKAELASHINPEGVRLMLDAYKDKISGCKETKGSKADIDEVLRYIDKAYTQLHDHDDAWEKFTDVLRDCWRGTGCQHDKLFLSLATMYARVYTSTHLPKYTLLDKEIENLNKQTAELVAQARDLDKLVANECRSMKKSVTVANKPVIVSRRKREKAVLYEATIKVALEYREPNVVVQEPQRRRRPVK